MRLLLLILFSVRVHADPPLRLAVDTYNAVGSTSRLVGFMKIGASVPDQRYLAYLNTRVERQHLPQAILSGGLIYFRGLDEPLKIVDLRSKQFSYNGRRLDLRRPGTLEARMRELENILFPRSAFFLWDFLLPEAVAGSDDPRTLSTVAGVLATQGLTSSSYCLADEHGENCSKQFMGSLAAIGAVGGVTSRTTTSQVFCSPDFSGGQKFVVGGAKSNLLSVSYIQGDYEISPTNLRAGTTSANKAAAELIASCRAPEQIQNMNIALAQPTALPPVGRQPQRADRADRAIASVSAPIPVPVATYAEPAASEQGGATQ